MVDQGHDGEPSKQLDKLSRGADKVPSIHVLGGKVALQNQGYPPSRSRVSEGDREREDQASMHLPEGWEGEGKPWQRLGREAWKAWAGKLGQWRGERGWGGGQEGRGESNGEQYIYLWRKPA